MRIAQSIFAGSIAVLTAVASSASAAPSSPNSHASANAQAPDSEPTSPSCYAYQKAPDGSWVEKACHEGVETASPPVHGNSAHHHSGDETTTR
jgi:hypothetical protein